MRGSLAHHRLDDEATTQAIDDPYTPGPIQSAPADKTNVRIVAIVTATDRIVMKLLRIALPPQIWPAHMSGRLDLRKSWAKPVKQSIDNRHGPGRCSTLPRGR